MALALTFFLKWFDCGSALSVLPKLNDLILIFLDLLSNFRCYVDLRFMLSAFIPILDRIFITYYFSGLVFDTLYVTYEGYVLAKLKKHEAVKAHCLQYSALYNFGVNYQVSHQGKSLPGIKHFFDFITSVQKSISKSEKQCI